MRPVFFGTDEILLLERSSALDTLTCAVTAGLVNWGTVAAGFIGSSTGLQAIHVRTKSTG